MSSISLVRSFKRLWWAVVALVVIGAAAGAALSTLMSPTYESSSRILVAFDAPAGATAADLVQANNFAVQKTFSYVEVVKSPRVLDRVIDTLGLDTTADELALDVSVTVPSNSAIMKITASAATPDAAAALSQAIVKEFSDVVFELETPTSGGVPPIRIESIETATPPSSAASPKVLVNIALGMLIGLAAGLLWVGVAASLDRRLYNSADIVAATRGEILSLGSVPSTRTRAPISFLSDEPLSAAAEAYRTIAVTLGHSSSGTLGVVAVAPVNTRETASALTFNLALAFSDFGARVIVVYANLRSGEITSALGLEGPGLADALNDPQNALTLLQTVSGVAVLPAGTASASPAELIGRGGFDRLLRELRQHCDLVLVDSASALPLSDTLFAADAADATVLAATSGALTTRTLQAAVSALTSVHASIAGVVVTGAPTSGVDADAASAAYRDVRAAARA